MEPKMGIITNEREHSVTLNLSFKIDFADFLQTSDGSLKSKIAYLQQEVPKALKSFRKFLNEPKNEKQASGLCKNEQAVLRAIVEKI